MTLYLGTLTACAFLVGCGRLNFEMLALDSGGPAINEGSWVNNDSSGMDTDSTDLDASVEDSAAADSGEPGVDAGGTDLDASVEDSAAADSGEPGVDANGTGLDASIEDSAGADSGEPGAFCGVAAGAFTVSAPVLQTTLSAIEGETEPSFQPSGDITFSRQRPNSKWDLYSAADEGSAFGTPQAYPEFGSAEVAIMLSSSADGLHGLITWHTSGEVSDIYLLTRNSTSDPWTRGALASITTSVDDWDPWLSRDGLRVYFSSEGHGGTGSEILFAERASVSEPFGTPDLLTELNSAGQEGNPSLTADELAIVFTSDRTGGVGLGDIYYATRPTVDTHFGAPALMPVVNTSDLDWDSSISGDGCQLLFVRGGDIYLSSLGP